MRELIDVLATKLRRGTKVLIKTHKNVHKTSESIEDDFNDKLIIKFKKEEIHDLHDRFILLVMFLL